MHKINNLLKQIFIKEKEGTRKITEIINSFSYSGTDNLKGTINVFTLLWRLIDRNENYNILKECNNPAKLRDALRSNMLKLSSSVTLNMQNYIYLKTDLNKFYKWLRNIAEIYKNHSINLNKEEIIKALADKSPNILNLFKKHKNNFSTRLLKLVFLPKIKGDQGGYAIERPIYRNEDQKLIEDFVKFITENTTEKQIIIHHLKNKSSEYLSFIKRKKLTSAIIVVGIFFTTFLTHSISSEKLLANIFNDLKIEENTESTNIPKKENEQKESCLKESILIVEGYCKKNSPIQFEINQNTKIISGGILQVIQIGRDEKIGNYVILRYKSENEWIKVFLGNISFDNNSTNLVNLKTINKNTIISDNLKEYFLYKEFNVNTSDTEILKIIKELQI